MKRIVHLADIPDIATPLHAEYGAELLTIARAAMVARGLRYDNATGIICDNDGWLCRFSNPSDHEPMQTLDDVMQWQFRAYINNSASRMSRGYSA